MHHIYRLNPADFYRYKTHLLCLDDESKYMRFGFHAKYDAIMQMYNRWKENPNKHVIFAIENEDLEVVAVGHISLEDTPVELAFSVATEYQGQGMGSALMARAIEYCQNRGIKAGCMVCLTSNDRIKKLAQKHGLLINEGGEILANVEIPAPSPISILHEAVDNNMSAFDHLGKAQRKFAKMFTFPLQFLK